MNSTERAAEVGFAPSWRADIRNFLLLERDMHSAPSHLWSSGAPAARGVVK
jgi:hypothetical protein